MKLCNGWHCLTSNDIPKRYRLRRIYTRTVSHRFWLAYFERLNLRSMKYKLKYSLDRGDDLKTDYVLCHTMCNTPNPSVLNIASPALRFSGRNSTKEEYHYYETVSSAIIIIFTCVTGNTGITFHAVAKKPIDLICAISLHTRWTETFINICK